MRILQVIPFFSPKMGGSPQVVYQISRYLSKRGHEVTVVASDYALHESRFEEDAFDVVFLRSRMVRWGLYPTPGLVPWLRNHISKFDIVHLHEFRTFQNAAVRRFALRHAIPYVLSAHGTLPVIMQRKLAKRLYDLVFGHALLADASRMIAISPVEVDQYAQAGVEGERIALVPNGLSLEEFSELPSRGTFRRRLGIADDVKVVLFLGRLHRQKGVDHLVSAFAQLCAWDGDVLLVVVGPDEGELAKLQAMVGRLGLDDKVQFVGPLYGPDRLAAYVDVEVLAYPAVHEIFGLVPFEALMCGTPVVVTDDCGCGHLISDAGAGYLVTYGDVEALTGALRHALTNPSESQRKVKAGQAYIRDHLDWEIIVDELVSQYLEVIGTQ